MGLSLSLWRQLGVGLAVGLAVLAHLGIPAPTAAQTRVRSVQMFADLAPDDGDAEVRMLYVLEVAGTAELRFELLGFGDATAPGFWLGERRTGTPILLAEETGSMRATDFTLNLGEGADEFQLEARYLIRDAVARDGDDLRVHVPVLVVAAPPADDVVDVFHAEVLVPDAWRVSEGFPSGLDADAEARWIADLAVVPSVVSLRARADGAWRPGVPLAIDVTASLVLLVFGLFGWRHLSGVAAQARRGSVPDEGRP